MLQVEAKNSPRNNRRFILRAEIEFMLLVSCVIERNAPTKDNEIQHCFH